jgi:hypothetical protein
MIQHQLQVIGCVQANLEFDVAGGQPMENSRLLAKPRALQRSVTFTV